MTSEERRQKRYERRKQKREEKAKAICDKTLAEVYTYENMLKDGDKCCLGVGWKTSTINFESTLITQVDSLQEDVLNGTYKFKGFKHFKTIEHGKERDINALVIQDRCVQKCYCDEVMTDAYSRSFIYDNSASLPDKGMDMTLKRLEQFLHEHYRKYGLEGGIFQFDFHGYFASIPLDKAKARLRKHIHDPDLQKLGCQLIDDFVHLGGVEQDTDNPHGVGLGSQVSQNIALDFASPIDHYIKDKLGIRGYARYMDDGYVISDSLEFLYELKSFLYDFAKELGIEMNEKKCIVTPFKNHSFKFLKMRIRLEPNGKVVIKMSRNSIKAIRRKLRIFRGWVDTGKMNSEDVVTSYQSWRSHAGRCNSYRTVHSMDLYFVSLFEKELAERDKKFKCTLDARWNYEIGWFYFTSKKEWDAKMKELDDTRYQRYMDGFIPLVDRWDYRMSHRSKDAMTFSMLREIRESYNDKEDDNV
jgi:hypothetical protein